MEKEQVREFIEVLYNKIRMVQANRETGDFESVGFMGGLSFAIHEMEQLMGAEQYSEIWK